MEYNLNTELKAKDCQICDELYTLIHLAISSDEVIPGQVWSTNVNYVYGSHLKKWDGTLYIIDDKEKPAIVLNMDETYIATMNKDINGETIYVYSYYDEKATELLYGYCETANYVDIIINIESNFEKLGLEPDIVVVYDEEELQGTNGIIDVIEKLKQDQQKQKVKA